MRRLWTWAGNHLRVLIIISFVLGTIAFTLDWLVFSAPASVSSAPQPQELSDAAIDAGPPSAMHATATPGRSSTVIVYISGAVGRPDVYELPSEARIKDLVLAAGGLSADADLERINLAERLKDSDHVHVPRLGEAPDTSAAVAATASGDKGGSLNINTASVSDLDGLPGIGQSFAQRIIEYRTTNGPFTSVDDLQKVKGIGAALFAKIAPLVSVGP